MAPTTEQAPRTGDDDEPVRDETTITDLVVDGRVPKALSGQYVRIGPNPIERTRSVDLTAADGMVHDRMVHDGMVHGITLHDGRPLAYRNRWARTVATSRRLGAEPVPGPRPTAHDAATTNVIAFGGRLFALDDGALAYELDAQLETVRRVDLAGGGRGIGAHPKADAATGELHLLSSPGEPSCQLHIISAGALTRRSRAIGASPAAVRDLAITQDHVVLVGDGVIGLTGRGGEEPVAWHRADLTAEDRVVNAYDDGDTVILDVTGRSLRRVAVEAATRDVNERVIDRNPHALGRTDDRLVGLPHRYLYSLGGRRRHEGTDLVKHDLEAAQRWSHRLGPGRRPGAFVFVADPERLPQEDGGWLVGLVHNDRSERTSLLVLDAADVTAPPLATVHIPRRVPAGRHATWVPWIA